MDMLSGIVSAIAAAGASLGRGVLSSAGKDLYLKLKDLLRQKGSQDLDDALCKVEADTESKGRREVLAEELEKVSVEQDETIRATVKELASELREQSLVGNDVVDSIIVQGNGNKVAGDGSVVADRIEGDVKIDNRRINAGRDANVIEHVSGGIGCIGGEGHTTTQKNQDGSDQRTEKGQ